MTKIKELHKWALNQKDENRVSVIAYIPTTKVGMLKIFPLAIELDVWFLKWQYSSYTIKQAGRIALISLPKENFEGRSFTTTGSFLIASSEIVQSPVIESLFIF